MSRSKKNRKFPDPVVAYIDSLSHEGRGIARINGKTVFVDGALPGESVKLKYISSRSKYDEAVAIEIIEASAKRAVPECEYFMTCGGCSLQHLQPAFQLQHKQQVLLEQLNHIGHLQPEKVLPPLAGNVWAYRHKARLGVKYVIKKDKVLVGFRERRKPYIADMDVCKVLHPAIGTTIGALKLLMESMSINKHIPQIEVAVGEKNTAIVIRHMQEFTADDIARLEGYAGEHDLDIYLQGNQLKSLQVLGDSPARTVSYEIDEFGIRIDFLPLDFTQVNFEMNKQMISLVIELLAPDPSDNILDLFCGIGNFSLPLATLAGQVTGIEGSAPLVERARSNALLNNIHNCQFHCLDLCADITDEVVINAHFDKILLDPPRTGAREIIEAMDFSRTSRVVYVSCNPATLARDAGILVKEQGFTLSKAGVIDMFPHTTHVESVAVFDRIK